MSVVIIPFEYEKLASEEQRLIVPICIQDEDREGRRINWGWFTAIVPIADRLRSLAKRRLGDEWMVSELAEGSVHSLWYKHQDNLGVLPSMRIYCHAKWRAEDLRAGGRNARRGVEVELLEKVLAGLPDPADVHDRYEAWEIINALKRQFETEGAAHVSDMLEMWLYGWKWDEIADEVGKKPKAATKDFWRAFKKGLQQLNLL
jgi:hypothetical protein